MAHLIYQFVLIVTHFMKHGGLKLFHQLKKGRFTSANSDMDAGALHDISSGQYCVAPALHFP